MIRVTVDNGETKDVEADASRVLADGTLQLFTWQRIGKYACPLNKEKVAEFSKGAWHSYTYIKDEGEGTST